MIVKGTIVAVIQNNSWILSYQSYNVFYKHKKKTFKIILLYIRFVVVTDIINQSKIVCNKRNIVFMFVKFESCLEGFSCVVVLQWQLPGASACPGDDKRRVRLGPDGRWRAEQRLCQEEGHL